MQRLDTQPQGLRKDARLRGNDGKERLHTGHANRGAGAVTMRGMSTILLAEDEAAIAETVLYALRADGYEAEHVLLGGSVLPRLARGGIDLVILDVGLPDRSGFDVCRELREASAVPVIRSEERRVGEEWRV